jgi:hypothetical protein
MVEIPNYIESESPKDIFCSFYDPTLYEEIMKFAENHDLEIHEFSCPSDIYVYGSLISIIDREFFGIDEWENYYEVNRNYSDLSFIILDNMKNLKISEKWRVYYVNKSSNNFIDKIKSFIWREKVMSERKIEDKNGLYHELEKVFLQNPNYVKDGIVDCAQYDRERLKILWVLKEPNGNPSDLREFLRNPQSYNKWKRTWEPVFNISYKILKFLPNQNEDLSYEKVLDEIKENHIRPNEIFQRIAAININKTPGGKKMSREKLINCYVKYRDLILMQIEKIDPDIVIFGGTFWVMWNDLKDFHSSAYESEYKRDQIKLDDGIIKKNIKYHYNDKRIFIETYHPNQRTISKKLYYELIVSQIKKWCDEYKLS